MYDCKDCHGSGFIRQFKRKPLPSVVTFEPEPQPTRMGDTEEVPCPNCGGLRQRMEYAGGAYRLPLYEHETRIRDDKAGFERHALETAARGAFHALIEHGAFKLERRDPEDTDDPRAEVEYVARMAVIMPAAHNYFDEQLEAARAEGRQQICDMIARQRDILTMHGSGGSVLILRGLLQDIKEKDREGGFGRLTTSTTRHLEPK